MELKELKQEELAAIYGGSEASNEFCYLLGAFCKVLYNLATEPREPSAYSLAKVGY